MKLPFSIRPGALGALLGSLVVVVVARGAEIPNGFSVRFSQTDVAVTSHAPAAAFALPVGSTPHPEVREFGWGAVYSGVVRIDAAGRYRFGIETLGGDATLIARDSAGRDLVRTATDRRRNTRFTGWQKLSPGEVLLEVEYKRGARGEGMLRTLWEMEPSELGGFRAEPIPSSAVSVPTGDHQGVSRGLDDLAGRVLLRSKGCTNCHGDANTIGRRQGPHLDLVGARASAGWISKWIDDPATIRAHADMPRLVLSDERDVAPNIAAYLASLAPAAGDASVNTRLVANGRALFHTIGCIACHGALESAAEVNSDPQLPREVPTGPNVHPYGDLRGKWNEAALAQFLADPIAVHPDGRMPSFSLKKEEANALAAYLLDEFGPADSNDDATTAVGDAELGRVAFQERSCSSCHAIGGAPLMEPNQKALAQLDPARGCLSPRDLRTPRYDLSDAERKLLAHGIEATRRAQGVDAPLDECEVTMANLSCRACHSLDGVGGPREGTQIYFTALDDRVDLGDEGRIPPDLSSVGFKLNRDWSHRVLTEGGKARPYMGARMPQFGDAQVGRLADLLARRDGVNPGTDVPEPTATDEMSQAGRLLVSRDGMNCVSCHQFKDYPPAGTPGPFLNQFAERLRYEWWRSYLQAPARFKPGTRMPAFSIGRQSHFADILSGDIYRQGDALWSYFNLGEFMPAPNGLAATSEMKIDVGSEPIVFRTFLRSAGPRGIAVGTPEGVHYAFDAQAVRLVEAWKGDFLDASGAWAGRGGSEAGGLGPLVWNAPPGPAIAFGPAPTKWPTLTGRDAQHRFKGYELDAKRYPTFLYTIGDTQVREKVTTQLVPVIEVHRTFTLNGASLGEFWINGGDDDPQVKESIGAESSRHEQEDGAVWFRFQPTTGATEVRVQLEVTQS